MTNQQKQYDKASTTSGNHNQNDNDYRTTDPGVYRHWTPEEGERILEAYTGNVSEMMTMGVATMIEDAYQHGMSVDDIILACHETGFAPRPSPAYLRKILENWAEFGVTQSKIRHASRVNSAYVWWKKI